MIGNLGKTSLALIFLIQAPQESTYQSFLNMGARLIEIHEPQKALGFYRKSAGILPERDESYREMSRTLVSLGEKDEAAFWWREAFRRSPNDEGVKALRAQFPAGALDESASGKVARIDVRYLGRAEMDAGGGGAGSVDAGKEITRSLLFAQAFDESGRIVSGFKPEWTGASGTNATPSKEEKIVAKDPATGVTGEVAIRVLGPTAAVRLFDVTTRKELKEALYVAPGEKRSVRVLAADAAGNGLALKAYRWTAEKDGRPAPEVLQTDVTYSSPEFPFEPVANVFRAPDVKEPTPYGIVVTDPATGVRGRTEIVAAPNVERVAAGRQAVPWIDRFEEALKTAQDRGKLVMVEFEAPW